MIFKKGQYRNKRLAIVAYEDDGSKIANVTENLESVDMTEYGAFSVALNGGGCPQEIFMYLMEKGYIKTIGKGIAIGEERYPIAIVNQDWLESIDEIG